MSAPVAPAFAPAGAGLGVAPVSLAFPVGGNATSTVISNTGGEALTVQVRVFAWETRGDEDVYTQTRAVAFSPAVFALPPGARQLVRLLLRAPATEREAAYRLVVDQLPMTAPQSGLRMPVRMLLPVFAPPATPSLPAEPLSWGADYDAAAHAVRLSVRNDGNRHVRLVDLSCTTPDGVTHEVRQGLAGYALAGQSRTWSFPLPAAPRTLLVKATGEAGPLRAAIELAH